MKGCGPDRLKTTGRHYRFNYCCKKEFFNALLLWSNLITKTNINISTILVI